MSEKVDRDEAFRLLGEIRGAMQMQVIACAVKGCVMREANAMTNEMLREEQRIGDVERRRLVELADALEQRIRLGMSLCDAAQSLVADGWVDVLDDFRRARDLGDTAKRSDLWN